MLEQRWLQHMLLKERQRKGLSEEDVALPVGKTVNDICDDWLEYRTAKKRSPKDDQSIIRCHIRPILGQVRLRSLTVQHVDALVAARGKERTDAATGRVLPPLSPQTLLHVLTLLKSMLVTAQGLKWVLAIPEVKKPKVPKMSEDYHCLRTNEEIIRFLRAAREDDPDVLGVDPTALTMTYMVYATAIYTGMREGELAGLEWPCVDLENRLITVQRSFHSVTKTAEIRRVPIVDALYPLLLQWKVRHPGQYVFTNEKGKMFGQGARVFKEVFHRVLIRAGFPRRKGQHGKERGHIRFHDLRHTFASHWMMTGGDRFRLQKILGHSTPDMTERYVHLQPEVFVSDYARFGDGHIKFQTAAVVSGKFGGGDGG